MNTTDKVRVLLPHWIEHNQEHGAEFLRWAETLAGEEASDIEALLQKAAAALHTAEHALQEALDKAGGPLPAPGQGSGGHQHHHH